MSSIVVWQKGGSDGAAIVAIYRPLGTRMPEQVHSEMLSCFFLFSFLLFDFFLGPAFVCLSQAFCCEGSELILLIVLLGRNLDLNLL